jgi:molybdopterin molybdotransferase
MALGITEISVAKKPRIGIISSGDEVVPPELPIQPGQVRDVNTYTLQGLVEQAGGIPISYGIAVDTLDEMRRVVSKAHQECELVVITAGSSASARDLTSQVIDELGEPGVLVHGVNVRPGKPTILGVAKGKPLIGLPGNPVSALVIAGLFVEPVIQAYLSLESATLKPSVIAELTVNLSSQAGREDWVAVQLIDGGEHFKAQPVFGKSNLIFTLTKADGLIRIPPDANGLPAGEAVTVFLF